MKKSIWMSVFLLVAFAATVFMPVAIAATEVDTSFAAVQSAGSALLDEPVAIWQPNDMASIATVSAQSVKPVTLVVTPDAEMNVTLGDTTIALETLYRDSIKDKFIPAVQLTEQTSAAFIDWMRNRLTLRDVMAISADINVLEALYADEICFAVNTVYDLTAVEIPSNRYELWQYVGAANRVGCNILMFAADDENLGTAAQYLSAMTKVCWAKADSELLAVTAIAAGCQGILGSQADELMQAMTVFDKTGYAKAQYIAAHRGITAYANENSLTALAASVNEGATHIEVDLQITTDGQLILCHESDAGAVSTAPSGTWCANASSSKLKAYKLNDYNEAYGDTFPTLDEVFTLIQETDVTLILELKLDNGSALAVSTRKAIETLKNKLAEYPKMTGKWFAITFYAPYAEDMRKHMPEIPVGFLGYAKADNGGTWSTQPGMNAVANKIRFLRTYNLSLDETYTSATIQNRLAYLARGYVQNAWTYKDLSHFTQGVNIATTDAAQDCAMRVREICPSGTLTLTESELAQGSVTATCVSYNGWQTQATCQIKLLSREGNQAKVLLYLAPTGSYGHGLYSRVIDVTVA